MTGPAGAAAAAGSRGAEAAAPAPAAAAGASAGPDLVTVDWIDAAGTTDPAGTDVILGRPAAAWRAEGRAMLGLAAGGSRDSSAPLVVTGHQAGPWHPGILAKYALLDAARRTGARTLDLLVEHDTGDPLSAAVPVREAAGRLGVRRLTWGTVPEDRAMCLVPAATIRRPSGPEPAVPARERLEAWREALVVAGSTQAHVAGQVRAALAAALPPSVAPPEAWAGSADLLETPLGRAMVAEMVRDPWACAAAHARAVRRWPGLEMPVLHVRDDFVELPLWRLAPDGLRRRADDVDAAAWLEGGPGAPRLAPRALLLTAITRFGLADVFIHGRGGADYDRAMQAWMLDWLGARPAPAMLASADLRLPLGVGRASRAAAARRGPRQVAAHRVWHDPEPPEERDSGEGARGGGEAGGAGGQPPGPVKRELLAAIDAAPRGSKARRRAWRRMHRQLEALRGVHVGRVEAACRRADEATRAAAAVAIAGRRDWFAALHEPGELDRLAAAVAAAPATSELAAVITARP